MSRATSTPLSLPLRAVRGALRASGRLPAGLLAAGSRWLPVNADGEHISPEMLLTGRLAEMIPGIGLGGGGAIPQARARLDDSSGMIAEKLPPLAVEEDLIIDGEIPATRYRAEVDSAGIVVFYHGGGFVLGSRRSHDGVARRIALETGADVLSVDYRLAPEHPFPAAPNDAVAAWRYAVNKAPAWGVSADKIVVAGDSAGANLAAVVAQSVRGEEVVPVLQLLIYPVTDLSADRPSKLEFASGYYLTKERMDWFADNYVPDSADRTDPRVSPLLADDLSGLAPAHIVVAGFDPLRDEGIEYADKLTAAGTSTTLQRESGLIHGFANMAATSPASRVAIGRFCDVVVDALG